MYHLNGSRPTLRTFDPEAGIRVPVSASFKGRCLAHHSGLGAVSRSLPAWPLRPGAFSGPPGGAWLAAYPCELMQSSSGEFCTGADPHR